MVTQVRKTGEYAAFLAAPLAPAALAAIIAGSFEPAAITYVFAIGHLLIALPIYLAIKARSRLSLPVCAVAGLLVGAVPVGIVSAQLPAVLLFGACGLLAGAVFWFVLQISRELRQGWARIDYVMLIGAVAAGLSLFVLGTDTSKGALTCHDIRDSGRANRLLLSVDAKIPSEDWGKLVFLSRKFAADEGLSYRNSSDLRVAWPRSLEISMCADSRLRIGLSRHRYTKEDPGASDRGVDIAFFVADPHDEWQQTARELIARLESEWPQSVRFRDRGGRIVPVEQTNLTPPPAE